MIKTFKEVIVVEGNHDASRIKRVFPNADFIITYGSGLSEETVILLKKAHQERGLILMLDPDYPGNKIRIEINKIVGETKHIYLEKSECKDHKSGKIGIEHASLKTIKDSLDLYVKNTDKSSISVNISDLYSLNLAGNKNAKTNREKISNHFKIGFCNAKTLCNRLNMFSISKEAISEVLNEPS